MNNDEEGGDSEEEYSSNWQGTCPSCREPIPPSINNNGACSSKPNIQVNTALKAVLNTLYGTEMNQRGQAAHRQKMKAQSGEMGGMHTCGCEEIVPLTNEKDELSFIRERLLIKGGEDGNKRRNKYEDEENGWVILHSSLNQPGWQSNGGYSHGKGGSSSAMIRRNIVLDDSDQQYQLSLGLRKCSYSNSNSNTKYAAKANNSNDNDGIQYGVLDIELCLLTMEEDEVDDSGFPTFVNEDDDDEALICTGNDRIHTSIEAAARVVSLSEIQNVGKDGKLNTMSRANEGGGNSSPQVQELSLSRGMIGRDGAVRFRIDLHKALTEGSGGGNSADLNIVKLRFVHVDTGAVLELRLPSKIAIKGEGIDGEVEFCGTSKQTAAMNFASRYLLDDHDEDEDEDNDEPNKYQEDGFVVHGSQDSSDNEFDDEGDDDEDDDDGECQICKNGGDLIVCDGGDHDGGCGHMYHLHCIGRSTIPPGEYIYVQ